MRVVPVFATLVEGTIGAKEEDESEAVALVLFGYMCHAGIDTPAINRIAYLRAIGSDIMHSCLGYLVSKTEIATHVVVGFAELVVCEETTKGVVERADGLLKCCGVVIEGVLVLVQTICDSDSDVCLLVTSRVAA